MQTQRQWLQALSALLALLFLVSVPALAQTFRGNLNGTVTDPSGAVVPGAKITLTDVATAVAQESVSNGAGEFAFNDLPQDTYNVEVSASGFQTTEVKGVQVLTGKVYTLPVKLAISQQA